MTQHPPGCRLAPLSAPTGPAPHAPAVAARQPSTSASRSAVVAQSARSRVSTMDGSVVAGKDMKFGVVVGRFNDLVTKLLLEGALEAFERHGASLDNVQVGEEAWWRRWCWLCWRWWCW